MSKNAVAPKKARRVRCVACGVLLERERMEPARDPRKWCCKNFVRCFARFAEKNP